MRGLSSKLAIPDRRSGAVPTFMPMMFAIVKMRTPDSADAFSSTRICAMQQKAQIASHSLIKRCLTHACQYVHLLVTI